MIPLALILLVSDAAVAAPGAEPQAAVEHAGAGASTPAVASFDLT